MRTLLIIVLVLGLLAAVAAFVAPRVIGRGGGGGDGTPVRVEPAIKGKLSELVSAPGVVQPETKVAISARVSALITELPFREGQVVKQGEVVVRLDAKDIEARLRAARARYTAQELEIETANARIDAQARQIESLQVQLSERRRDLERQQALLATSDVAQSVVDTAQSAVDQLIAQVGSAQGSLEADRKAIHVQRAQLAGAKADVEQIEDSLNYTTIRAPMTGTITKLEKEVGELAIVGTTNTPGTEVLTIADLSKMIVEAKVDETSIAGVKEKQDAEVRVQAYRGRVFKGKVERVALAQSEEKDGSKYYKAEIALQTDGVNVLSGLTADVEIEVTKHEGVVKVPSQAVLGRPVDELPDAARAAPEVDPRKTLAPVVYRFVDGKAVVTPVRVGPSDVTHTMILSGLNENDLVVTGPYKTLEALKHDDNLRRDVAPPTTKSTPTTSPTR